MFKRAVCFVLLCCSLWGAFQLNGYALGTDVPVRGVCGEGLTWEINGEELSISGSGAMEAYPTGESPWYEARGQIRSVKIDPGVTAIGSGAFYGCRNLTEVTFSGRPPEIQENAFQGVIAWARYPEDGSWTAEDMGRYGGILVWKGYCVHEMLPWISAEGYDGQVRTVGHRGGSFGPENTLVAYELAGKHGFSYVEGDVQLTKDRVPVLLHDDTVDRTSDGAGYVSQYTYEQLLELDFGSWLDPKFAGTKIPTFEQFLQCCLDLGLKPYIELKSGFSSEDISILTGLVRMYGMEQEATWISFDSELLRHVIEFIPGARVGYLVGTVDEYTVSLGEELLALSENAFVSSYYTTVTGEVIGWLRDAGLPLEVWTVNDPSWFSEMDPYISGVTSDTYVAGQIRSEEAGVVPAEEVRYCAWCDYRETRKNQTE